VASANAPLSARTASNDGSATASSGGASLFPSRYATPLCPRNPLTSPPRGEVAGDRDDGPLAHAEDEQVRLRRHEHGRLHGVRPVVVVRDPPQRRLDAADHHGDALRGLAAALRVDRRRAVGAQAGAAARRVRVVVAALPVRRVVVDHRVHVAGGHGVEEARRSERAPGVGARPVGLRQDGDAEARGLEHAAEDGHREARVVHVGVPGHEDDVRAVPAAGAHLLRRGRQKGPDRHRGNSVAVGRGYPRGP